MTEHSTGRRTAVITGAASERGIGRALAARLAGAGWHLGLLDIDPEVEKTAARIGAEHAVEVVGAVADIADPASVDAAVTAFEDRLPPVTGLVNSAGISSPVSFLDTDLATWERVMRTNATGTFVVSRRIVPGMAERGHGRVVSLGSTAMQNGGGTYSKATYAASKGAVEAFSRGLALEVAPSGVTVNVVAPATIDTDIMGGRITDDRKPAFLAQLPVGRLGTTRDVAALVEFLLGDDAGYITGATYNLNGGLRIG
ncbi:SDR family NAD(P)-dependent oxidoreductase [Streptomyces olivaceus]|uniref:SDR family NAD(P)-dependent oxidoreductase n=1 Tax=Streptomyces TaxID=1883 RepID=UPI0033F22427